MTILETALNYLEEYHFPVIPTNPAVEKRDGAKVPYVGHTKYRKQLPTRGEVIEWWTKWPNALIACIPGELSGLMVIDADHQAGVDKMNELLPDSLEVPIVKTPRNEVSRHYYFKYRKGLGSKTTDVIELKSENSLIALPGSIRKDGRVYEIENGGKLSNLPDLPIAIYNYLLSFSLYKHGIPEKYASLEPHNIPQIPQNTTRRFTEPGRNDDLFHLIYSAIKGEVNEDILLQACEIIVRNCNPPLPLNELRVILKSAAERASRKERNIAQVVNEYVEFQRTISQECHIEYHIFAHDTTIYHKSEDKAARMQFKRLCECNPPVLEKEKKRGCYRIIDVQDKEQKWWLDEGKPLNLIMPLGIEKFAKVFQGNIILLEGAKSAGKTTFALEFARMNRNLYKGSKTQYLNVEMSDGELKERQIDYEREGMLKKDELKDIIRVEKQTDNWSDKIMPDQINIVDYLMDYAEPFKLPQCILDIHKKLKTGICLCLVQRDPLKPYPFGGRGVRDLPRLIITIMNHRLRLEDVKSFIKTDFGNPSGLSIKYKQVAYCKWIKDGEWEKLEDSKYDTFKKNENRYKSFLKED